MINNSEMGDDINLKKIFRSRKIRDSIFTEKLTKAVRTNFNLHFIKVFVGGKVFNLDNIIIKRFSSLNNAILLADWAKVIKLTLKFISYKSYGTIETREFAYSKKNNTEVYKKPLPKSVDIIRINRNIFNIATDLLDELIRPLIGGYAAIQGFANF